MSDSAVPSSMSVPPPPPPTAEMIAEMNSMHEEEANGTVQLPEESQEEREIPPPPPPAEALIVTNAHQEIIVVQPAAPGAAAGNAETGSEQHGAAAATAKTCEVCGKSPAPAKCAACKVVWYCSRTCQAAHWPTHKLQCTPVTHPSIIGRATKPTLDEFAIPATDIGAGNFSRVMKATHLKSKELFALKVMDKDNVKRMSRRHKNIYNEILMEKEVLLRLKHPGIIQLYHTWQDEKGLYYLLEFCPRGELWSLLMYKGRMAGLSVAQTKWFGRQLALALEYMHGQGVVHRDLKPENVMLTENWETRIIDFGTAKDLVNPKLNGPEFVGTPDYLPPEIVDSAAPGSPAVDMWAFGVMVFQMLCGKLPFKAPSAYLCYKRILAMDFSVPASLSADAQDFINRLLVKDPTTRMTARQALDHPFLLDAGYPGPIPVPDGKWLAQRAAVRQLVELSNWPAIAEWCNISPVLARWSNWIDVRAPWLPPMPELQAQVLHQVFQTVEFDAHDGQWAAPFVFLVASTPALSPGTVMDHPLRSLIIQVNNMDPEPKLLVVTGAIVDGSLDEAARDHCTKAAMDMFVGLKPNIRLLLTAEHNLSHVNVDSVFGTWEQGVRFLSFDQPDRLAAKQSRWLDDQLEVGRFGAQHMATFSSSLVPSDPAETTPPTVAKTLCGLHSAHVRAHFVRGSTASKRHLTGEWFEAVRRAAGPLMPEEPDKKNDDDSEGETIDIRQDGGDCTFVYSVPPLSWEQPCVCVCTALRGQVSGSFVQLTDVPAHIELPSED